MVQQAHVVFFCCLFIWFGAGTLGPKAWSARTSNFDQRLIIDLGQTRNITRIATQGRPLSSEFVEEYTVSYGTNNQDYADYKEPGGNIKVEWSDLERAFYDALHA